MTCKKILPAVLAIYCYSYSSAGFELRQYPIPRTIQEMIDQASEGDTVLILDGTYTGEGNKNLDFNGKNIVLKSLNGPESVVIDCEWNGGGFYFHSGESESSKLDGFTIIHGETNGSGNGIKCVGASPEISNCVVKNNGIILNTPQIFFPRNFHLSHSGGGIYMAQSSARMISCVIDQNNSTFGGGGIYIKDSEIVIEDCDIVNNFTLSEGGGIYMRESDVELFDSVISKNWCSFHGAGLYCYNGVLVMDGCDVSNNENGEPNSAKGGGANCVSSTVNISNCIISNNLSKYDGGGIRLHLCNGVISNCAIINNMAHTTKLITVGGGIQGDIDIINCLLIGNHAGYGGGVAGSSNMTNCTFYGNSAIDGGGSYHWLSTSIITNCIYSNNQPDEIYIGSGEVTVSYSDIKGGWPGEGNIDSDPLFVEPDSLDFNLLPDSPCIDTGDPTSEVPLGGGSRIDMGAFEYWHGWNITKSLYHD